MVELVGKYASAKIFTDQVGRSAIAQVQMMLNQPFCQDAQIRFMPDIHAGMGATIGTTMTLHGTVCPSAVGVDIGCGMEVVILQEKDVDLKDLDETVHRVIPAGAARRTKIHDFFEKTHLDQLICKEKGNLLGAALSLGTLGSGNHFIELDQDEDGMLYLVIHSGSRHLGIEVEKFYQNLAVQQIKQMDKQSIQMLIQTLKANGESQKIASELDAHKKRQSKLSVNPVFASLSGYAFDDYIHDMRITQEYAMYSRKAMAESILTAMNLHAADEFCTIHNYIDTDAMILRKGAVSAQKGERLIIPINMRDGSILCTGKGNPDWNCSAPHGAGRLMSRGQAKQTLSVTEFQEQMKQVYSSSVGYGTLDESPMAYRSMDDILSNIDPTVQVDKIIRPLYNFKAGQENL